MKNFSRCVVVVSNRETAFSAEPTPLRHMSYVISHMPHVICHMSRVTANENQAGSINTEANFKINIILLRLENVSHLYFLQVGIF